jgi:hypothetical protein
MHGIVSKGIKRVKQAPGRACALVLAQPDGQGPKGEKAGMVKWRFVSEITPSVRTRAPGILRTLATAFDHVAARPYLILPAFVLDLFLWFGPRLNLAALFNALAASLVVPATARPEVADQIALAKDLLTSFGSQFNLFSVLSTFPVGVPSLMAGTMPMVTPVGEPTTIALSDPKAIALTWLCLTVAGLGLATVYHAAVARAAAPRSPAARPWALWGKVLVMSAGAYLGLGVIVGASLMAAALVTLITPFLGTGVAFLGFTLLFWSGVYLVFTPHGLVGYRLGLVPSMRESVRIVRRDFFPVVGLLSTLVILSWVAARVWELPSADSWFSLLAVVGHAFVSAMVLLASYVFYVGRHEALAAESPAPDAGEPVIDRRDARGA